MKRSHQIIVVEDVKEDYDLITHALSAEGERFNARRIDDPELLSQELERLAPDVVLCDHGSARWCSLTILEQVREFHPGMPFVVVSGSIEERMRRSLIERGVDDCVEKQHLRELGPAVRHALRLGEERRRRRAAEIERDILRQEIAGYRARVGPHAPLPICAECHQIRDDKQSWRPLEEYLRDELAIRFTHGLCPCCVDRYYADARDQLDAARVTIPTPRN